MGSTGWYDRGFAYLNRDDCNGGCRRRAAGWERDGISGGCRVTASAGCNNRAALQGEQSIVHRSGAACGMIVGARCGTDRSVRGHCVSCRMSGGIHGRHRSQMEGMRMRRRQV